MNTFLTTFLSLCIATFVLAGCKAPTTTDLIQPDAAYEIDTWGSNSEVYEFTTTTGRKCVVFILDNLKSTSLECTQ